MNEPQPFLRWVGGKRALLPALRARMPAAFGRYYEPFVGGGALFFDVRPRAATLSDANPHLIRTYTAVRDRVVEVVCELYRLVRADCRAFFNAARACDPAAMSHAQAAAWFLYLNRACFNGLWRVNRSGQFNVPYGRAHAIELSERQVQNFYACSAALQGVELRCCDYAQVVEATQPGDFVYFDPPYMPFSAAAAFTSYTQAGFGEADQVKLAELAHRLRAQGVHVLISNSAAERAYELYAGMRLETLTRSGRISCNPEGRDRVAELLAS